MNEVCLRDVCSLVDAYSLCFDCKKRLYQNVIWIAYVACAMYRYDFKNLECFIPFLH